MNKIFSHIVSTTNMCIVQVQMSMVITNFLFTCAFNNQASTVLVMK